MTSLSPALYVIDCDLPASFGLADTMNLTEDLESLCESISFIEGDKHYSVRMVSAHLKKIIALLKTKAAKAKVTSSLLDMNTNWLLQSYQQFPPLDIDRFFIYGSHYDGKIPAKKIALKIDAATAFGSGEHGTTKGCLELLSWLKTEIKKPKHILDMGTGSGILALAAYELWHQPTLAIDNDKESVKVACRHRRLNNIPSGENGVICAYGDGFAASKVKKSMPFDLIIANILAAPLIEMAPIATECLSPKGHMLLSGILKTQATAVKSAYRAQGLKPIKTITRGDWVSMILKF